MPGYWWECEDCAFVLASFKEACGSNSVAAFIWDKLRLSNWDQTLLQQKCSKCGQQALRVTYEFPGKDKQKVRVLHILGHFREGKTYLPMLWETCFVSEPENHLVDFKYIDRHNGYGLNKPAVLDRENLSTLLGLYREKTGEALPR